MNDYQNLYTLADGTTGVPLVIPMAGARMGGGRSSGHIAEGKYALLVESCETKGKSDKAKTPGVSFVFGQKTAAPAGYEGIDIVTYVPQPQHYEAEADNDLQRWQKMVLSVLSGSNPAMYQQCLEQGAPVQITSDFFVGKYMFVYLKNGKGNYSDRSEIAFYITKEEYEKNPGPVRKLPTAGGQPGTPEIGIVGAGAVSAPVAAPIATAPAVVTAPVAGTFQPAVIPAATPLAAAPVAAAPVGAFVPPNGGVAAPGGALPAQTIDAVKGAIGLQ